MAYKIPTVSEGELWDGQTPGSYIRLDSPQWFTWLESPTTTRFSYALFNRSQGYFDGFMTARKECRQRGAAYWSVYRRQGDRLRKVYLGPSSALTQDRLGQVATLLHTPEPP